MPSCVSNVVSKTICPLVALVTVTSWPASSSAQQEICRVLRRDSRRNFEPLWNPKTKFTKVWGHHPNTCLEIMVFAALRQMLIPQSVENARETRLMRSIISFMSSMSVAWGIIVTWVFDTISYNLGQVVYFLNHLRRWATSTLAAAWEWKLLYPSDDPWCFFLKTSQGPRSPQLWSTRIIHFQKHQQKQTTRILIEARP